MCDQRKFIVNSTNQNKARTEPPNGRGAGGNREEAKEPDQTEVHRAKWGRAARGDRAEGPAERQQKGEKTWKSAKHEATRSIFECGPVLFSTYRINTMRNETRASSAKTCPRANIITHCPGKESAPY